MTRNFLVRFVAFIYPAVILLAAIIVGAINFEQSAPTGVEHYQSVDRIKNLPSHYESIYDQKIFIRFSSLDAI